MLSNNFEYVLKELKKKKVYMKGKLFIKCAERGLTDPFKGGNVKLKAFMDSLKHACKVPNTDLWIWALALLIPMGANMVEEDEDCHITGQQMIQKQKKKTLHHTFDDAAGEIDVAEKKGEAKETYEESKEKEEDAEATEKTEAEHTDEEE